jgi:cystathionine beta-lyase/cystathionine gamma-synthase
VTKDEFETLLIRGAFDTDPATGALTPPIYQTATYKQFELGVEQRFDYSRSANPTRALLEDRIALLEEGRHGYAFSSGMAAITAVLCLFRSGDEILVPRDLYGGTLRLLDAHFKNFGLSWRAVDTTDLDSLTRAFSPSTRAIILESPTNPTLRVSDIAAVCEIARSRAALSIVDNTFLTPYFQRPITMGADIVIHSATKYLAGHNDVLAGLVVLKDDALAEEFLMIQKSTGGVLAPFDSYLLLRGIKTLAVRLDREAGSALAIAKWLSARPEATRVYYPGLETDPGYGINSRQADAAGGLLSFDLDEKHDIKKFTSSLELFTLAESLGSVESMACHPATMSHASISAEMREEMGISYRLIRLAVGLEGLPSLIGDLEKAFDASKI